MDKQNKAKNFIERYTSEFMSMLESPIKGKYLRAKERLCIVDQPE